MEDTVLKSLWIKESLHTKLKKKASGEGKKLNEVVELLIKDYLKTNVLSKN